MKGLIKQILRAILRNLQLKFSTVNIKQIWLSCSDKCMFTELGGRAFGAHIIFIYMNTFPEKWNKITLFDFKKYELE